MYKPINGIIFLENQPPNLMPIQPITRTTELEAAIAQSHQNPVLLFKHSATCSISIRADREMHKLTEEGDPMIFQVVVQRSRNLSNWIAEHFGIRHESPQIILLHEGIPTYHSSHFEVTAAHVRQAIHALTKVVS